MSKFIIHLVFSTSSFSFLIHQSYSHHLLGSNISVRMVAVPRVISLLLCLVSFYSSLLEHTYPPARHQVLVAFIYCYCHHSASFASSPSYSRHLHDFVYASRILSTSWLLLFMLSFYVFQRYRTYFMTLRGALEMSE